MDQNTLLDLANRIRRHAYTWGQSEFFLEDGHDRMVEPFRGGAYDPFPGEPSFEVGLATDMADVMGIETDGDILLVFTMDGRYAKLGWDRMPWVMDPEGDRPRIFRLDRPEDAQKPYETHGFN
ncbi:MAG: hypothetical protein AAGE03_02415 [Pseudomonadota bacterium]